MRKSFFWLKSCILSCLFLAACSRYAEEPSRVNTQAAKPRSSPSQQSSAGPEGTTAELFDLSPGTWEIMTEKERRAHLESLIGKYESRSPEDPARTRKFPALYFALATLLSRSGEGAEALTILDRIPLHPQTDSLLYLVRGQVYQSMSHTAKAMDNYLMSFSMDTQPWTWQRLDSVAKQLGFSQRQTLEQVRRLLGQQAQTFASFDLATPQGQKKSLADFSNQAILVNFFFPGCTTCEAEFPHLENLIRIYGKSGLSAVAINIQPDLDSKVSEWRQERDFQIPALVGADPDNLEKTYGVTGAPETFLLDRSGKILFRHIGFSPGEERVLEAQIRVLLDLDPFPVSTTG